MTDTRFTDQERHTLMVLALGAIASLHAGSRSYNELLTIVRKLEGVDTQLVAQRRTYWTRAADDDVVS